MSWSKRERRLWLAALGLIVLIYSTLYFVRGPVTFLREHGLLRLAVAALFAGAAGTVIQYFRRRGVEWREGLVLAGFACVLGLAVFLAKLPEEKLHFLEYGLLGALLFEACRERARRSGGGRFRAALLAAVLAGLAGWGDEGIQALLPNRFYDVHDILWNLIGSTLVILALFSAETVRRRAL